MLVSSFTHNHLAYTHHCHTHCDQTTCIYSMSLHNATNHDSFIHRSSTLHTLCCHIIHILTTPLYTISPHHNLCLTHIIVCTQCEHNTHSNTSPPPHTPYTHMFTPFTHALKYVLTLQFIHHVINSHHTTHTTFTVFYTHTLLIHEYYTYHPQTNHHTYAATTDPTLHISDTAIQ